MLRRNGKYFGNMSGQQTIEGTCLFIHFIYIYARRMIRRVTIDFGIWREIEDGTRSFRTMEIYTLNKIDSCARFYDIKIYIILYPRSQGNNNMG